MADYSFRHFDVEIWPSSKKGKKWDAVIVHGDRYIGTVTFGDEKYHDFTQHHDVARQREYLRRHGAPKAGQNWTAGGLFTPGWWAKHLLWSHTTRERAAREIERQFPHIRVHLLD